MAVEMTVDDQRAKAKFRTLLEMIDAYTACAIRLAGGHMGEAAKLLGVGRSTLYRRAGPKRGNRYTPYLRDEPVSIRKLSRLRRRLEKLRETTEASARELEENLGTKDYHLGMANGLILARHIMEGRTGSPSYL